VFCFVLFSFFVFSFFFFFYYYYFFLSQLSQTQTSRSGIKADGSIGKVFNVTLHVAYGFLQVRSMVTLMLAPSVVYSRLEKLCFQ
jgi:hypothetical protein